MRSLLNLLNGAVLLGKVGADEWYSNEKRNINTYNYLWISYIDRTVLWSDRSTKNRSSREVCSRMKWASNQNSLDLCKKYSVIEVWYIPAHPIQMFEKNTKIFANGTHIVMTAINSLWFYCISIWLKYAWKFILRMWIRNVVICGAGFSYRRLCIGSVRVPSTEFVNFAHAIILRLALANHMRTPNDRRTETTFHAARYSPKRANVRHSLHFIIHNNSINK